MNRAQRAAHRTTSEDTQTVTHFASAVAIASHRTTTSAPRLERKPVSKDLIDLEGEARALPARGITLATCEKWGYTVGTLGGQPVQIASHRDPHTFQITAQHIRGKDKDFKFLGDAKTAGLWGRHLWREAGKRVIITEGQIDAMSVDQALGGKWQVVSLPNGTGSAKKAIAQDLEWLLGFDNVVLCFDMDEPGRKCVQDCAIMFPPGKLFDVTLPLKDANDMLMAKRTEELVAALWGAKAYRPDGIVTVADVRAKVLENPVKDLSWCFPEMDKATYGRRFGELVAIGAGTGVGKTSFIAQQTADDLRQGHSVAAFAFEASPAEIVKRIAGVTVGKQFHIPGEDWTPEDLEAAVSSLEQGPGLFLYDHFGACNWEVVRERIRFLRHTHGVRVFYIDNITALAAAADDERTCIEKMMAEKGSLVKELDCWIGFVSHLATPEGTPHEEGGRVKIRHFKGSRAIGFWSHFMIGLERNQQAEDEAERSTTVYRMLKDRYTGRSTGQTYSIRYDQQTGRLVEAEGEEMFTDETASF